MVRMAPALSVAGMLVFLSATAAGAECDGVNSVEGTEITLKRVVAGYTSPVDATAPESDTERLYVVLQAGIIRIINIGNDSAGPVFLDIRSRIRAGGERGLLGLAFHPNFAENGYFYVNYTRNQTAVCSTAPPPGCTGSRNVETVVSRFRANSSESADPNSEMEILSFCQPFSNHNGGQIAFGPHDGFLYIATGDGGSGGDPCNSGQRPESLLGKILRIDVDNPSGGRNYGIPASNPFLGSPSVRDEIWSLGMRNPWRFAFDRGAEDGSGRGDLYIADVGQNAWEEIDYEPASSSGGLNYEWRRREGNHNFSTGTPLSVGTPTGAILDYGHGGGFLRGCSVTGGRVYRGCRMPDLSGTYFFADFCNNWVATMEVVNGAATNTRNVTTALNAGITGSVTSISSFGEDARGEIYILSHSLHQVFRVVPSIPPNNPPTARIEVDPSSAAVVLENGSAEVNLDGSSSDDGDKGSQGLTFEWQKVSGPDGDTIATPGAATTVVTFSQPGIFKYSLTVNDGEDSSTAQVSITVTQIEFQRGDANGDGKTDISDDVKILLFLFDESVNAIPCDDAADNNDDGLIDVSDALYGLNHKFNGGPPPPAPYPDCGPDGTEDDSLGCAERDC